MLERFDQLVIRYLSKTMNGDVSISDESQHLDTVAPETLPFTLIGQVRARWRLDNIDTLGWVSVTPGL